MTRRAISRLVMIEDQVSYGDAFEVALSMTQKHLFLEARAEDADAGVELCMSLDPDLVLADYRLADGKTGTQFAKALRTLGFAKPIVVLTGYEAPQIQREAAQIENTYLLSKQDTFANLVIDLRAIIDGEPRAYSIPLADDTTPELSIGELEVLEYLNIGMAPADVADRLYVSLHTVRSRIKSMHRKLGVTRQTAMIVEATKRGLLVPPT